MDFWEKLPFQDFVDLRLSGSEIYLLLEKNETEDKNKLLSTGSKTDIIVIFEYFSSNFEQGTTNAPKKNRRESNLIKSRDFFVICAAPDTNLRNELV